ncbi:hypothetical protein ScPMuIL_013841 [Solemya velum]
MIKPPTDISSMSCSTFSTAPFLITKPRRANDMFRCRILTKFVTANRLRLPQRPLGTATSVYPPNKTARQTLIHSGSNNARAGILCHQLPRHLVAKRHLSGREPIAGMKTADVQNYHLDKGGRVLAVEWNDGTESRFHSLWLRYNCQCDRCRQHASNQRVVDVTAIPDTLTIQDVNVTEGGDVFVTCTEEDHTIELDTTFLKSHCYSRKSRDAKRKAMAPTYRLSGEVQTLSYEEMDSSEQGFYKWLKAINEDGMCLLKGVPTELGYLKKVVERIGPVQATMYGEIFDVVETPEPTNAAYSNVSLAFHMDQQVYEAAPGLQFLHCIRFDDSVTGGETTFVDMFHTAEEFRRKYPDEFRSLTRLPCTFDRIHFSRDNPVYKRNRKPHFVLNDSDDIVAVNWHPGMEGPLSIPEEDVDSYYHAYQIFAKMVNNSPTYKQIRFRPGDLITFNNRRMAHGRNAFKQSAGGVRHLQGAYVDIDSFKSKTQVLSLAVGDGGLVKRVGSHCWD